MHFLLSFPLLYHLVRGHAFSFLLLSLLYMGWFTTRVALWHFMYYTFLQVTQCSFPMYSDETSSFITKLLSTYNIQTRSANPPLIPTGIPMISVQTELGAMYCTWHRVVTLTLPRPAVLARLTGCFLLLPTGMANVTQIISTTS